MKKVISEYEMIPRFYAVSWYSAYSDMKICYPVGIHILMHYLYEFYCYLCYGWLIKHRTKKQCFLEQISKLTRENRILRIRNMMLEAEVKKKGDL